VGCDIGIISSVESLTFKYISLSLPYIRILFVVLLCIMQMKLEWWFVFVWRKNVCGKRTNYIDKGFFRATIL